MLKENKLFRENNIAAEAKMKRALPPLKNSAQPVKMEKSEDDLVFVVPLSGASWNLNYRGKLRRGNLFSERIRQISVSTLLRIFLKFGRIMAMQRTNSIPLQYFSFQSPRLRQQLFMTARHLLQEFLKLHKIASRCCEKKIGILFGILLFDIFSKRVFYYRPYQKILGAIVKWTSFLRFIFEKC